jgi:hypothetical protein
MPMTPARLAFSAAAAVLVASVAYAQTPPPAPPPPPIPPANSSYSPQVTPPPPPDVADPDLEPQVTIIRRDEQVVEEVRIKGELQYVKVTPRHGRPYFLIPTDTGAYTLLRSDELDIKLKVPMWVLFSW